MRAQICLSALVAMASAMPAANEELCGPTSNCELATRNGTGGLHYRSKGGLEPGSQYYQRRFHEAPKVSWLGRLLRRDDDDKTITTKVLMGKTMIQWGCETDVKKKIGEAVEKQCSPSGGTCDEGTPQEYKVKKWRGDDDEPSDAKLKITLEGKFSEEKYLDNLSRALQATADKGVKSEDKKWAEPFTAAAMRYGTNIKKGQCKVNKFPNYVAINRYEGRNIVESLEFHAEIETGEKSCLGPSILSDVAGAVNPIAGAFFGVVTAVCEETA
ncbi:hypothetical protein F4778DRAFT_791753 [Xylariomycetidae sp. FL2044]|nr:hypothetical protein F4778DRAFT_791753 [Xylariomycetidae sp. FL2044]